MALYKNVPHQLSDRAVNSKLVLSGQTSLKLGKMASNNISSFWNDTEPNAPRSDLGLIQMNLDETATSTSREAFIMYLDEGRIMQFITKFKSHLIDCDHKTAGLLSVHHQDAVSDIECSNQFGNSDG